MPLNAELTVRLDASSLVNSFIGELTGSSVSLNAIPNPTNADQLSTERDEGRPAPRERPPPLLPLGPDGEGDERACGRLGVAKRDAVLAARAPSSIGQQHQAAAHEAVPP